MKPLWKVTLCPPGEVSLVKIRADSCVMEDGGLYFRDEATRNPRAQELKAIFAPGQWVCAERIYEDGESENAANYNAYKELEKDA